MYYINKVYYELIMSILALLSCLIIIVQECGSISYNVNSLLNSIDKFIWIIFVLDYFGRLIVSKNKRLYIKNNMIDLVSIIPLNSLFKSLRIFKITRLLKLSKFLRLATLILKFKCRIEKFIKTNNFNYVLNITIITVLLGALGISFVEKKSFPDSLWWSFVTTTTVGYGDISPETGIGRIIASILMLVGIGFVGMLTGTIATFFIKKKSSETYKENVIENIKEQLDDFESLSKKDLKTIYNILMSLKE